MKKFRRSFNIPSGGAVSSGTRQPGGRPKGSRDRKPRKIRERVVYLPAPAVAQDGRPLSAETDDPVEFLRSILRDPRQPQSERVEAARLLLPFTCRRASSRLNKAMEREAELARARVKYPIPAAPKPQLVLSRPPVAALENTNRPRETDSD